MSLENMKTLTEKVMWELENRPETQDCDRVLLCKLHKDFYGIRNTDTYFDVMMRRDLPNPESVRRSRQKIQEECEWLRGKKKTQDKRYEAQEVFIDFSQADLTAFLEG